MAILELSAAMSKTMWRNEEARQRLENWSQRFQDRIASPVETRQVHSRLGDGRVLLSGSPEAPKLLCLHAMRTGSAFLLSELNPLLTHFRVIAPDIPGQSVHGPQVRVRLDDDSYATWLTDVMDELEIDAASLFGVSWGGFVARQFASENPDRVDRLGLLVPAGIANGSHLSGLVKMAWPMTRYRVSPTKQNLRRLLASLFTTWDDDWAMYFGDSLRDMPFDFRIPPIVSSKKLQNLNMPVLVLGAADDISFPGAKVVRRICEEVPNSEGEVLSNCKHCPPMTSDFREWLANRLSDFFLLSKSAEPSDAPESPNRAF